MNKMKRWGVALKKNVILDTSATRAGATLHDSWIFTKAYTTFRKFHTRKEAREFRRTYPNKTVTIDLLDGALVR